VFVLHEVFGYPHGEITDMVGKSVPTVRRRSPGSWRRTPWNVWWPPRRGRPVRRRRDPADRLVPRTDHRLPPATTITRAVVRPVVARVFRSILDKADAALAGSRAQRGG
jgi:hypothetical protein